MCLLLGVRCVNCEHTVITGRFHTLSWIWIVLTEWNNIPRIDMQLHQNTVIQPVFTLSLIYIVGLSLSLSLSLSLTLSKILEQFQQFGIFHIPLISHSSFYNIIVCSDLPTVSHAVFSLELAETEIFQYNCSAGFNLIGDNAVQCQPDATWTNIMFTCTSKYQCTPTNNYLY